MNNDTYTVILCGGRGERMKPFSGYKPKSLLKVHNRPILWYILKTLKKHGLYKIIFPLGYKGNQIKDYVENNDSFKDLEFSFVETGVDTLIKHRISAISHLLPKNKDFLLINSDTIFDFEIKSMYEYHKANDALVTLASVELASTWGLLVEKNNKLIGFSRKRSIEYIMTNNEVDSKGFIYSGIAFLHSSALELVDLDGPIDFEEALYQKAIEAERALRFRLDGSWFAIDTPKDLATINSLSIEKFNFV